MTHPVHIGGKWFEWVEYDEVVASKGVDETAAIALSEHVQYTRLVEVNKIDKVLHLVQRRGICLGSEIKG